jgi:addiction module HigA family antidote
MIMNALAPDHKNMASPLPHPGGLLLREYLKPMGVSQSAFARHIGVDACVVSSIVKGKRSITLDLALKISAALGTSAEMWLRGQYLHDLTNAYIDGRAEKVAGKIEVLEMAGSK